MELLTPVIPPSNERQWASDLTPIPQHPSAHETVRVTVMFIYVLHTCIYVTLGQITTPSHRLPTKARLRDGPGYTRQGAGEFSGVPHALIGEAFQSGLCPDWRP
jgi:hypothetical protein